MRGIALTLLNAAALSLAFVPVAGCRAEPAPATVEAPLELTGRVVDRANMIPADREAALVRQLAALERDTEAQLVVVTTPSLGNRTIEEYSLALGRGWGIGHKDRDDGVLLVVAPNERKVRIEVGYGLEEVLPDDWCFMLLRQEVLPRYSDGKMVEGTMKGARAIDARLREQLEGAA